MASSLGVSHYLSQTPSLVLDKSWTGTLPSSQIKNVHLMRKEKGDGGGGGSGVGGGDYTNSNLLHVLAYRHIPRHTFGHMQKSKQARVAIKKNLSLNFYKMHTHANTHTI